MDKILLYIITLFFMLGAIDYLLGNKMGLSKSFEKGIKTMGPLSISMIGILSVTPIISTIIEEHLAPFIERFNIDPSVISSSLIAVDMGGYNIAMDVAKTNELGIFAGLLMSSILGCTISFTLPLALGLIKGENIEYLTKGILCGIITAPIGLFVGGLILRIPIGLLLVNLIPIILLSLILSLGIVYKPNTCIKIFSIVGKGVVFISIIGLIIQGINSISGILIVEDIMPLSEVLTIVGKIALFLGGAYVMISVIEGVIEKRCEGIEKKLGMNKESISAFLGSFASAIIVFDKFSKLDNKGKIVCSAFSVSGAYVLGGQLGYIASVEKEYILLYIFIKLLSGFLAVALAIIILKNDERKIKL